MDPSANYIIFANIRDSRVRCGCSRRVQEERTNSGRIENVAVPKEIEEPNFPPYRGWRRSR